MQSQCINVQPTDKQSNGSQGGRQSTQGAKKKAMTWFGQMKTIVEYNLNRCHKNNGDPDTKEETKYFKNSTENCWLC